MRETKLPTAVLWLLGVGGLIVMTMGAVFITLFFLHGARVPISLVAGLVFLFVGAGAASGVSVRSACVLGDSGATSEHRSAAVIGVAD